jgi:hypothetical protein
MAGKMMIRPYAHLSRFPKVFHPMTGLDITKSDVLIINQLPRHAPALKN